VVRTVELEHVAELTRGLAVPHRIGGSSDEQSLRGSPTKSCDELVVVEGRRSCDRSTNSSQTRTTRQPLACSGEIAHQSAGMPPNIAPGSATAVGPSFSYS
jgi:hypothetical protein